MNTEQYLLTCLMEECAELAHITSKAIRFGLDNTDPLTGLVNVDLLRKQASDVFGVFELLNQYTTVAIRVNSGEIDAKKERVEYYMEKSRELGILE